MNTQMTGAEIRKSFIDFFTEKKGHTFVPSSSLVPGGDQTLLFANAGMVQFKDVFLGEDERPYTRAVNSQKCLRVAGKHNDLDEVGRDNTHHTFFEMLGNWSFGDYYKAEAIAWAWELLTEVWGLDKNKLWVSVFKDDYGIIPDDVEAAEAWAQQPGFDPSHITYFGRKDNLWEMAETGPCGPCSEIHIDLGSEFCSTQKEEGHVCAVNGDCGRFIEFWNLVFMQYNRLSEDEFVPLPKTHVDTGMGFERIVSILQGVYSNYKTDLFAGILKSIRNLAGQTEEEMYANFTPYRVIADHVRSASFLIADGVVPGNTGRNYICRMIIRRASRFGGKIGLSEAFMATVAEAVIDEYGDFYPELIQNRKAILDNITREEVRFHKTLEAGLVELDRLVDTLEEGSTIISGADAFDLYATHGLPLELTRDILRESNLDVDEAGFKAAMEQHRLASGGGKAMGALGGEEAELFRTIVDYLIDEGKISSSGVGYFPYQNGVLNSEIQAIVKDGKVTDSAYEGDEIDILLPETNFYVESGGQVSDKGKIIADNGTWKIDIDYVRKPAAGVIVHHGTVSRGIVHEGDCAVVELDIDRRWDIMRNHTATHLLHMALKKVLGDHARQAGSMVAPDRLRFDFTHPEAMTTAQLREVERLVNEAILDNHSLIIAEKSQEEALAEGATALFGEKYGQIVRTISIGGENRISYELCGGTHVPETGLIGTFIILNESSAAAGVRRIEAVTGRQANGLIQHRFETMREAASVLVCSLEELPQKAQLIVDNSARLEKELRTLQQRLAANELDSGMDNLPEVDGFPVMAQVITDGNADVLRQLADKFREKVARGIVVLGTIVNEKPMLIAAVTDDLVKEGYHAGNLVKQVAQIVGGGGGGRPNLAQAGGRDASKLEEAIAAVPSLIAKK
jgi:alanyl-tRNA synthetase